MPRSRGIKYAFFTNDVLAENDPLARLLFMGLPCLADFKGCLEWRSKKIKAMLLPYDECDIDSLAINLDKSGFIRFYSDGARIFLKVVNFTKHQNPHKNEKEAGSDIPDYTEEMRQVIDLQGLTINRDLYGVNRDKNETDPAVSCFLSPVSFNKNTYVNGDADDAPEHKSQEAKPKKKPLDKTPDCPHEKIVGLYHEHCPCFAGVKILSDARKKTLLARWRSTPKHQTLEFWEEYFKYAANSAFLRGETKEGWKADFDFLINSSKFINVIEGKYHHEARH